ncbi:hypothetical protein [Bradyrhizobium lablabi]|uniref:hypothetical protein n=1 Tax=Bradyrhizobium lablabi TaxID=722472 RepID=UPI0012E38F9C|nr:hypothetical protein [Bradyrhizobium lablabi]
MTKILTALLTLATMTGAAAARNDGFPLGWIYIPTADLDCNKGRCDIMAATVEAHSRPDKKSPVVATLKGGTTAALVQDNVPYKWNFIVLNCSAVRNDDGSLSCK